MVDTLSPEVRVFADPGSAARAVADRLMGLAATAHGRGERFSVAFSGGRTPEPMFRALAAPSTGADHWRAWEVFWCDERLVPRADARSNLGLAKRLWIDPAGVPSQNVHPVDTSVALAEAARRYEAGLRSFFGEATSVTFSAVVLGVGPDGHTASLFPGAASLRERVRWVVGEPRPPQPPRVPRVTLTLEGLRRARHAIFLVAGPEKRNVLSRILRPPGAKAPRAELPAGRVRSVEPVEWYLDRDAAPFV